MKENKIDIILNSAEELMCTMEEPNRDITVDMIAKNAGIGKGSIYYYFESKEEIIDAVIERSYSNAIKEYFDTTEKSHATTVEKLRELFCSIIRKEFTDKSKNVIIALHMQDDMVLHYKMMMTAIRTVSPILTKILKDGRKEGTIRTDAPKESAEMIVAMLTFLLDRALFPSDDRSIYFKLKIYAKVLETCLETEEGTFDFLFTPNE